MAKTMTRDLTVVSPTKLVAGFMLPLWGGMLFQQFYNMVDTMIVGKYLGVNALAGVGSTGAICLSNPVAWLAADLFLIPAYFHDLKKLRRESTSLE